MASNSTPYQLSAKVIVGEQSGAKRREQIMICALGGKVLYLLVLNREFGASSGTEWEGMVLLQTARLRRSLTLQNALESGHFAALGAGLLSQLNHALPPGASGWS